MATSSAASTGAVSTAFSFGSFNFFCNQAALTVCPLVGPPGGVEPRCYSRNIEIVGGTLIFEPATLVIHLIALIMTGIMIYHIKSKYTAVGRKEIVMFFYMYGMTTIVEFLLVSGIIPIAFVGYKTIRISSFVVFAITFLVAFFTFQSGSVFQSTNPTGLFVVYFVFGAAFLVIYVTLQIILVVYTLDDRWPLGDLLFGLTFFCAGLILEFALSGFVCEQTGHYVDGMFFGTICTLLGVMMVYKYWDDITKEDLEFSVGGKSNVWEVREPFLGDDTERR
ncbi:Chitin synthase, class 7 [Irineochytrium annulatum]|nr:Chitin synthase, class 7 [Irineochytrium annulatum]